jgi:pantoate--beta-alanine ligase
MRTGTATQEAKHLRTVRTVAALRAAVSAARRSGHSIGLVPTMGSLHDGHLSLMRAAHERCGFVVASVFVNPTQFAPGEDYERYPRDERRDAEMAAGAGVDLLFAPPVEEVYPEGFSTSVEVAGLTDVLCGAPASRGRGHFTGVATVVAKLLNMCAPDVAFCGQKDYQQTLVIGRIVRDLDIPVRIEVCPTVREPDGLALSSRNAYLDAEQRARAASLHRALGAATQAAHGGAGRAQVREAAVGTLRAAGVEPEYVEVLRADDLSAPRWGPAERIVVAIAAPIGPARLIDNTLIELPSASQRTGHQVALAGG